MLDKIVDCKYQPENSDTIKYFYQTCAVFVFFGIANVTLKSFSIFLTDKKRTITEIKPKSEIPFRSFEYLVNAGYWQYNHAPTSNSNRWRSKRFSLASQQANQLFLFCF
jgi:hypothetical protein